MLLFVPSDLYQIENSHLNQSEYHLAFFHYHWNWRRWTWRRFVQLTCWLVVWSSLEVHPMHSQRWQGLEWHSQWQFVAYDDRRGSVPDHLLVVEVRPLAGADY